MKIILLFRDLVRNFNWRVQFWQLVGKTMHEGKTFCHKNENHMHKVWKSMGACTRCPKLMGAAVPFAPALSRALFLNASCSWIVMQYVKARVFYLRLLLFLAWVQYVLFHISTNFFFRNQFPIFFFSGSEIDGHRSKFMKERYPINWCIWLPKPEVERSKWINQKVKKAIVQGRI